MSAAIRVQVARGGLSSLLLTPDPNDNAVDMVTAQRAMAHAFQLLRAIVSRDLDFGIGVSAGESDADSPDLPWPEAFRKVISFLTWLLSDDERREKLLENHVVPESPFSLLLRDIGPVEIREITTSSHMERAIFHAFSIGLALAQAMTLSGGAAGWDTRNAPRSPSIRDTVSFYMSACW